MKFKNQWGMKMVRHYTQLKSVCLCLTVQCVIRSFLSLNSSLILLRLKNSAKQHLKIPKINVQKTLENPGKIYSLFIGHPVLPVNYFHEKDPSKIIDSVLNVPLLITFFTYICIRLNFLDEDHHHIETSPLICRANILVPI